MYVAVETRLDITYAVMFLAQFASHPGPDDCTATE